MPRSSSSRSSTSHSSRASSSYSSNSSSTYGSKSSSYGSNSIRPNSVSPAPAQPAPNPVNPVQQVQVQTTPPSFMSTVFQGVAWGMGSTIGRRLFEPRVEPEHRVEPRVTPEPKIISESKVASDPNYSLNTLQQDPSIPVPTSSINLDSNEIFKKYQECMERKDADVNCELLLNNSK
jgi:hypothetical protein